MFKYLSLVKWVNVALSVFLLSACGGGSANKSDPLPITLKTYEVLGGVVKGPLKYAKVRVYRYDSNTTSGYGTLVAEGTTNEVTQITGLEITGALASHYIMAFESTDETIDISTQMAPFISQFDTIVTSSQIQTGQPIYASALSSLALSIAHQKVMSNTPIATAIQESELLVKSLFGLGISADISLFTSPALLIESAETFEQQRDILQLRKAIEVFSTLTYLLKQDLNIGDLTFNELIEAIASDIIDGNFDGVSTNSVALPYNSEQLDIFAIPVGSLLLPNTNNVKVDSLNILIIEEASLLHSEILDTEQLSIGKPFNNFNHLSFVVDLDNDGIANSEDSDDDNDGTFDDIDVFPVDGNEWADNDLDGIGNNADDDDDNDTVPDNEDDFPLDKSESEDFDADGIGNNADPDDDNDDVIDENDVFPFDSSESVDTDNDGLGNNQDLDDDNDDILDEFDVFPLDQNESLDSDNDGIGNNADLDDDNDGTFDKEDVFPLDATESLDTDQDSVGNNKDTDDDNDGVADGLDSFPLDVTEQSDTDADGIGNNADLDDDNDGEPDISDVFPFDPSEISDNDSDGIGDIKDTDDDNDGVLDTDDAMPFDPTESVDSDLDEIGNNADLDDDNDNVLDTDDAFPLDINEWVDTDEDGIGNNADSDDDNDGTYDNDDELPLDATETLDFDKDTIGDIADPDDDNDGIADNLDNIHVAVPSQLQFEPETVINFSIRGLYTDGSILSGNDGWHIQYQVSDVNFAEEQIPFYSENGFYNATFNQAKNEWEVRFPVPDYSGEFEVRFSLYCSASSSICGDHDDSQNYFQREQTVSFLVNCADSSCGYQPESEPGINISASKVLDSLSASLVRNNGDIVATYIDQAENNWKNYVVKSSNDGRSWERIGQLPSFVFDAHIIELAQTSELLLIAKCGSKICLYSSTEGTIWAKQELSTTSIFANCNAETCDINSLSISDFIEADDGALSVFYTKHEDNKNLTYVSKSYDKVNWSTPINMFGSEYTTNIHSIITISDGSFAAAVISYEDYLTTIYISEDGNEWSPIESFSFIDSAKLVYKNSMLRLFYQKDFAIFEAYSDDLISFSTPNKLVDKSYAGFDAFALSNGDFGVIYNLYLNYQYDVFYEGFNLTTP
jgi:hypothetical protein